MIRRKKGPKSPYFPILIEHINQSWLKVRGFEYPFTGRDFRDLKGLSRIFQEWGVCALWDCFVNSENDWIKKRSGYSISSFCRCVPWLVDNPTWKAEARKYEEKIAPAYPKEIVDLVDKNKKV